mmetsp:Transcript_30515/g.71237  ORF Transcript_30515/g.71237 Transcript_30515/m.71237 type:complete len:332 (-) Transcript_30515:128-1123(-)
MGHGGGFAQTARLAWLAAQRDMLRMVVKLERTINCVQNTERGFHIFLRIAGPCFVCFALCLISFGVGVYFVYLCPLIERLAHGRKIILGSTPVGVFILVNVLYNYAKAILVDPGLPPEYSKALADHAAVLEESPVPKPRQCSRCKLSKPVRAHHCSVCKRCVLKMDHHCPWINNCVGVRNYRFFMLFMGWLWLLCVFGIILFMPFFLDALGPRQLTSIRYGCLRTCRKYIIFTSSLAVCICFAICLLGGFHVYLVLTNQTTIEFQLNMMERREARKRGEYYQIPWDLGRRRNFQQVFGPSQILKFRWLFSYWAQPPLCDGLSFPSPLTLKI